MGCAIQAIKFASDHGNEVLEYRDPAKYRRLNESVNNELER